MKLNLTDEQRKLVEDNHNLIYFYMNFKKVDPDESYHDLAMGLCKAARTYNPKKGAFSTYAMKCMENDLLTTKIRSNCKKRIPQDKIVHYENTWDIVDLYPKSERIEHKVIDNIIYNEKVDLICKQINNKKDKEVLMLLLKGYNMSDIAKIKNVSKQSIHVRIKRIRNIIRDKHLLEDDYEIYEDGDEYESN